MNENNIQKNYLDILKKLKTTKATDMEDDLELDEIFDHSNVLFSRISNTSELKLDAKVTEIHSDMFLKQFNRNLKTRKINLEDFIKQVNENKNEHFFTAVLAQNRKCNFAKFIDFDYFEEIKDRKTPERIIKVIKDVTKPSGQNIINEDVNLFLLNLEKLLTKQYKILFYDYILDFDSFDKTVENIFNVSIAVRSKKIMFYIDDNKIYLTTYKEAKSDEKFDSHVILDINYKKYQILLDKYKRDET